MSACGASSASGTPLKPPAARATARSTQWHQQWCQWRSTTVRRARLRPRRSRLVRRSCRRWPQNLFQGCQRQRWRRHGAAQLPPGVKLAGRQPRVNRPRGRHERRALVSGRAIARDDGPLPSRSAVGVPSAESQRVSGEGVVPTSKVEDDPCARVCACESGAVVGVRGGSGSGPVCEASKQASKPLAWPVTRRT